MRNRRDNPELHDSRFWVIAKKPNAARELPFAWSDFFWAAVLCARVVIRLGLERVRVVDRWSHAGDGTVWREGDDVEQPGG